MVRNPPPTRSSASTPKVSGNNGNGISVLNRILLDLPGKEWDTVLPKLTVVDLALHDVLQEAGQPIEFCYFPNTAMASILNVMDDGKSVEVGLAGREGFVGLPVVVAGFRSSASRVVTQGAGSAYRIDVENMRKVLRACPKMTVSLMRYSQEATMEVTQIAACNRLHSVEGRLARWLLMSQDRIHSEKLPLTQEFLSQMLGTRRASVSVSAAILQRAGLIHYNRGHVSILNRGELENASCECYKVIQRQLESWRGELS